MTFKRSPESFSAGGLPVTGTTSGPPAPLTRDKAPSPFRVRVASTSDDS